MVHSEPTVIANGDKVNGKASSSKRSFLPLVFVEYTFSTSAFNASVEVDFRVGEKVSLL